MSQDDVIPPNGGENTKAHPKKCCGGGYRQQGRQREDKHIIGAPFDVSGMPPTLI